MRAALLLLLVASAWARAPMPLLGHTGDHEVLRLDEEALRELESIKGTLSVTAFVGPYRSGKSTLANKVFGPPVKFGTSSSVRPETQGIWMWLGPSENGTHTLVLDTEGFFGGQANRVYDSKVFSIAALASSALIYNSHRNIDHQSIDTLEQFSWVANLFASATRTADDSEFTEPVVFPDLLWVLQDFALDLPPGSDPTAWLKQSLSEHKRTQELHDTTALTAIFPTIACTTLSPPAADRAVLRDVSSASAEHLSAEYRADLSALQTKVVALRRAKALNGAPVSPDVFVKFLRHIVAAANSDLFPKVSTVWSDLYERNGKQALREASMLHAALVRAHLRSPLNTSALAHALASARDAAESRIKDDFFGVSTRYAPVIREFAAVLLDREAAAKEENKRNVDFELSSVKGKVLETFFTLLKSIELPLTATELDAQCDEIVKAQLARYDAQTDNFVEFDNRALARQELETQFRSGRSERMHHNNQAIDAAIGAAAKTANLQFKASFTHQLRMPATRSKIGELYQSASSTQMAEFERLVAKYSYVALYAIEHTGLASTFTDTFVRAEADNLQAVTRLAEETSNQLLGSYSNTSSTWIKDPPYSTASLKQLFEELESQILQSYNQSLAHYDDFAPVGTIYKQLRGDLHRSFVELNDNNNLRIDQMMESKRKQLKLSADASVHAIKLPQPDGVVRASLNQIKVAKLQEYAQQLSAYAHEASLVSHQATLNNELTVLENNAIALNLEEQQRVLKLAFDSYLNIYRTHMQALSKKECSVERVEEEDSNAQRLASVEIQKIDQFREERVYVVLSKQSKHDRQAAYEQIVFDINQHLQRVVLNEATRVIQNFRITMDEIGLDKVPRNPDAVRRLVESNRNRSLEDFLSATAMYRSQKPDSIAAVVFMKTVLGAVQQLSDNLAELQAHYVNLNEATLKRLSSSVRKQSTTEIEKALEMNFFTEDSFNRWLYESVSTHMLEYVAEDPVLAELINREHIDPQELVRVIVSQDDPLGEEEGALNDYPELQRKLTEIRDRISKRLTWVYLVVTIVLAGGILYGLQVIFN